MPGTATIDFGATLSEEASVVVTGQTGITTGCYCEAFVSHQDTTVDNGTTQHQYAGYSFKLTCGEIVAGTSFTIRAYSSLMPASGTFKLRYVTKEP